MDSVLLNGVNGCLNGENMLIDWIGMVGCDWPMLIEFNQLWTLYNGHCSCGEGRKEGGDFRRLFFSFSESKDGEN